MIANRIFSPFQKHHAENVDDITRALRHANTLTTSGDFAGAANIFEQLACDTGSQQGLRAPFLYIQAGLARILLGQKTPGMAHIKHALTMLIETGRFTQLYRLGTHLVRELKARGLVKEAQEVAALVHSNMPAISEMPTERGPNPSAIALPSRCFCCSSPLHPHEIEWLNPSTGECPYCGSTVKNR